MDFPVHKITTIKELVDVANNENIDILTDNLRNFLIMTKNNNFVVVNSDCFVWQDDGKSDIIITIKEQEQ